MGVGTILSHGLSSYFGTKNAMDEQEYRRQMQERETQRAQREGQRHQAWVSDQARAEQERAESDKLYADMAGDAPSTTVASTAIESPSSAVLGQAEDAGIDQGNGVTTTPYGAAKPEALTTETMSESPAPQRSAPGAGAAVGAQPPGTGAPVEPITPAAVVASRGVQPSQPAKMDMPSLLQEKNRLDSLRLRAMKIKDPNAMAYLNEQGRSILGQWASAFDGDPTADPIAYAKHLAQAKTVFGEPLTLEQAAQLHSASKAYEREGVTDALMAAHRGDKAGALKAYDRGNHRFVDIELIPSKSGSGLQSNNVVGINADGTRELVGNAFDGLISVRVTARKRRGPSAKKT